MDNLKSIVFPPVPPPKDQGWKTGLREMSPEAYAEFWAIKRKIKATYGQSPNNWQILDFIIHIAKEYGHLDLMLSQMEAQASGYIPRQFATKAEQETGQADGLLVL